ncbi:uncharacterized protein LOC106174206 [Lingula anatina]|uniref:Uncharacterized protein LOC106174206 n=1 Tax=Lingula anatina TaxID=7574 RepID=A0A1S3JL05_LINAN|nr:uncharacterized protein LOC106174206 [Lingula anatina]|eukprot:XP_013411095.1 uncharacterized protein LOC106174206 [Lingula anatina]
MIRRKMTVSQSLWPFMSSLAYLLTYTIASGQDCLAPAPCECPINRDTKTTIFDCASQGLTKFPLFTNQSKYLPVRAILLGGNKLRFLDEEDFYPFRKTPLLALNFSNNQLFETNLAGSVFRYVRENLTSLDLSRNRFDLETLPWPFLSKLSSLRQLILKGNFQTITGSPRIQANAFQGLNFLEKLDISGCSIQSLDSRAFSGLGQLKHLNLAANTFRYVPEEALGILNNLKALSLADNFLLGISRDAFQNLVSLEELDLSNNWLQHVNAFSVGCFAGVNQTLKRFFVRHCHISYLPPSVLSPLGELQLLDLSENNIEWLEPGLFMPLKNLRELRLGGNRLGITTGQFIGLESCLKYLDISKLELTKMPMDSLKNLTKLEKIDASFNAFTEIDNITLQGLDVREVRLAGMQIASVAPDAFTTFTTHQGNVVLDLNGNLINETTWVDPVIFERVDLRENPLHCDCSLHAQLSELSKITKKALILGHCKSPLEFKGVEINDRFMQRAENCRSDTISSASVRFCSHSWLLLNILQGFFFLLFYLEKYKQCFESRELWRPFLLSTHKRQSQDLQRMRQSISPNHTTRKYFISPINLKTMFSNMLTLSVSVMVAVCIGLSSADDNCPASLPCTCKDDTDLVTGNPIYVIDCDKRNLTSVPVFTRYTGKAIDKIILSNNRIKNISETAFSAFDGKVKGLDFSYNILERIHVNAFRPFRESLNFLDLQDNSFDLSTLPWEFLTVVPKVTELDIQGSYKYANKMLPANAFLNLPNLKKLILSRSYLTSVHPDAFNGSTNLEKINLYGNSLTDVPVEALRGLKKLKDFDIDANDIKSIPARAFETLDSLEELTLSRLDLYELDAIHPDAFIGIGDSLKRLSFYSSYLSVLPHRAFSPLKALTELDITFNDITEFPPNAFSALVNLKTLEISGNPLNFTTDMFLGLEDRLETIIMRSLIGYTNSLPLESLKTLKKLKWIDASKNGWTHLTRETIAGLDVERLTLLWMDINHVAPDAFDDMKTYRGSLSIELDTNNLSDTSWIDSVIFQQVDLRGNPIHCTCHLYREISRGHPRMSVDGECATPEAYQGLILKSGFLKKARENCGPMPVDNCRGPFYTASGRQNSLCFGPLTVLALFLAALSFSLNQ